MDLKGCLLLDKPAGLTSFETIEKLRKTVGVKKIGHVGTLDPLATGLLLACLGKATKLAQFLSGWDKEYVAQIKLGATTDTWDRDGNLLENVDASAVSLPEVSRAVSELTGEVALLAPEYSALKYQGKKLYEYARAGQKVPRPTKRVKIYSAEILEFSTPFLTLKINCSKGTYIRSFAFELGQKLGCGAAVWELRRTKLGPHSLEKALTLDKIQEIIKTQQLESHLISLPDAVGHLPRVILLPDGYQKVKHGLAFKPVDVLEFDSFQKDRWIRILDPAKQLLAVGRSLCDSTCLLNSPEQALIKYERVLIN
jgi:tRNA pseudouridine55 synthase